MRRCSTRPERRPAPARGWKCRSPARASPPPCARRCRWTRPFADRPGDVQISRRRRRAAGCDDAPADRHAAEPRRILARSGRDARRGVSRLWVPAGRRRGREGRPPAHRRRPLCALARCRWRQHRERRLQYGRDRNGDRGHRQSCLRIRASVLQPRPDRIPDDQGVRPYPAAEPDVVHEDRDAGRRRRHRPAGSRDDHRRD